ncbi:1016_t:CDS:10 [Paraglomus brasilianum]|uniref:1016_t:CDS:1 n=1 Tax=Paraglomus brasilianum TaxID=144538 RepID=A0A9N8VKU9_9GLOM|nr:1016_t:CDS:10 [Paraglomus brasilianum]
MFYSEAILSKKGPLAKVWLAAHWERKLSKTQFLQTNIQNSVGAILGGDQPPMALRLSGQLLLGVVRIYSRKARYLLEDCNEALVKIKLAFTPGVVDMPEESTVANFHAITLPDNITEYDILLPEPGFNLAAWDDQTQTLLVSSHQPSNTSRPQDITIRDSFDMSLDITVGDDLLGDAFDEDGGLNLVLNFEDELDPRIAQGSGSSHGSPRAIDVEVARRDAAQGTEMAIEDIIGLHDMDIDKNLLEDTNLNLDGEINRGLSELDREGEGGVVEGQEGNIEQQLSEQRSGNEMDIEGVDVNVLIGDYDHELQMSDELRHLRLEDGARNLDDPEAPVFAPDASPRNNEEEQFQFQSPEAEPQQPVTSSNRRKRKILDEITELSNKHIAAQVKDTSDIVTKPSFLPSSRKLLRLSEIRNLGVFYFFDLTAPANILPELHRLFSRKRIRTQPPEPMLPTDSIQTENDTPVVETPAENGISTASVEEGPGQVEGGQQRDQALGNDLMSPDYAQDFFDDNMDSPPQVPGNDNSNISPEHMADDEGSPQGLTIFDQDDSQDQQTGSEVTFSKNTIKAMRLLQREFERTSNEGGSRRLREKTPISYETVAGKAKRQDAVKLFFELLVLKTKDVIDVQQKKSYGDIDIRPKAKMFDTLAASAVR